MDSFIRDFIIGSNFGTSAIGSSILVIIVVWSLVLKGIALWHAAQNREKYWFVAILIVNSLGVLEIAYLFIFSTKKLEIKQILINIKSFRIPKISRNKPH
ncbi:hypothetical protein A3A60_03450 [Candidatus Curtissbacteria bacterium RIFCSPLOWO2_01_FULL_42_26]|uniref:DUF5652 domain-containing protein n=1 Tax=Candidatus Curtissbacteria bacterium RIFCSPLOWO2_01_FULL_42_26 TaxID=1797729 RepID=A0A1F5I3Z6_9BACT|nr:MAG: hypothetical protein A3A60_03450 [Candidatus Curtissbacteria bacterium RIFCSPLOWO2_01_FULL_42_26]